MRFKNSLYDEINLESISLILIVFRIFNKFLVFSKFLLMYADIAK